MAIRLYAGGLAYSVNDQELKEFFESIGTVVSATVINDRDTGRSKGFGFVEMSDDAEAKKAIAELNGKEISGRAIMVNEARPQEDRRSGGSGNRDGGSFRRRY